MLVNAATERALEYIAARGADANRAFTPGARPQFDDVGTDAAAPRFVPDPLSVVPPADAYFITSDDRGRAAYTQNGSFSISDGAVVGSNGRPILGYAAPNAALGELRIDPVDAALGRAKNTNISADGSLGFTRSSIDPRTGARENERVVVGRIALARFPAGTKCASADAERVLAPPGVVPHTGRPGDGNFNALSPMHSTPSHIDLERSLGRLNDAYIAFDALTAAHKAQGAIAKTTMDLLK